MTKVFNNTGYDYSNLTKKIKVVELLPETETDSKQKDYLLRDKKGLLIS